MSEIEILKAELVKAKDRERNIRKSTCDLLKVLAKDGVAIPEYAASWRSVIESTQEDLQSELDKLTTFNPEHPETDYPIVDNLGNRHYPQSEPEQTKPCGHKECPEFQVCDHCQKVGEVEQTKKKVRLPKGTTNETAELHDCTEYAKIDCRCAPGFCDRKQVENQPFKLERLKIDIKG